MELLLASTSRYRRELLARLGVPFRCRAPECDEQQYKSLGLPLRDLAARLALEKARSLAELESTATIIGSDQICACGELRLSKPGSAEAAVEQLEQLQGREHQLLTALCVWHGGRAIAHLDVTTLVMRRLARDELERYVAADDPIDCAGSYKLEQRGVTLFERIESADHSAITGLPLIALTTILRELGYAVP
ncbi:MAG TPA: nucleoside triphosphate pyrophosphatase [Pirellulaceae bacterium]|nr:nucleoside triphosphate pyrophosphatase [Pirellulaceae bacterium]